jgi:hypothetical protein
MDWKIAEKELSKIEIASNGDNERLFDESSGFE